MTACAVCGASYSTGTTITVETGRPEEYDVLVCNDALACRRRVYDRLAPVREQEARIALLPPGPCRRGLDWLLACVPGYELLDATRPGRSVGQEQLLGWLVVELGQPSEGEIEAYAIHRYAIWKNTGAVHGFKADGSVTDDPIYTPDPPRERSTP